jgi:hypothetical protein
MSLLANAAQTVPVLAPVEQTTGGSVRRVQH